jgi:CBS domain-containing protein
LFYRLFSLTLETTKIYQYDCKSNIKQKEWGIFSNFNNHGIRSHKSDGRENIGVVLIIEDDVLKGILSERDYARKVVLKNKASKETFVHEIMDEELIISLCWQDTMIAWEHKKNQTHLLLITK